MAKEPIRKQQTGPFDLSRLEYANYLAGISYDYDRTGCTGCEDYCRCTEIYNARLVELNPIKFIDTLIGDVDPFTKYCLQRAMVSRLVKMENWEVETEGGYYGQEIGAIRFMDRTALETICLEIVIAKSNKEKLFIALRAEYGYILPELEKYKDWEITTIPRNAVVLGGYQKPGGSSEVYKNYQGPICLVLPSGSWRGTPDRYRLIDGYHRYTSSTSNEIQVIAPDF